MNEQRNRTALHDTLDTLDTLAPSFADPVHDTQAVFRTLLGVLSRPGTIATIETPLAAAESASNAANAGAHDTPRAGLAVFAALLALCDYAMPV